MNKLLLKKGIWGNTDECVYFLVIFYCFCLIVCEFKIILKKSFKKENFRIVLIIILIYDYL